MFTKHLRHHVRRASLSQNVFKPRSPFHVSQRNISSIVAFRALRQTRGFTSSSAKKAGKLSKKESDDTLSKLDLECPLTKSVIARAHEDPTWAFKLYSTLVKKEVFKHGDRPKLQNWKCQSPPELFEEVDSNDDGVIDLDELKSWFEQHKVALMRSSTGPKAAQDDEEVHVSKNQLVYVFLRRFVPFVGFGLSDTGIMVITAGALDVTVGTWFGLTTLTAAALGNCMSNFVALWVVGIIESLSNKLGIPDPKLTRKQAELPEVNTWGTVGSTSGMCCGCLGGLAPLFLFGIAFQDEAELEAHLQKPT